MKKFITWLPLALIMLLGAGVFIYSTPSKPVIKAVTYDPPYVKTAQQLNDMGFHNVLEIQKLFATNKKDYWKAKGFVFYSNSEFRAIIARSRLFIMEPDQYAGTIPTDKQEEIVNNLESFLATKEPAYAYKKQEQEQGFIIMRNFSPQNDEDYLVGKEPTTDRSRIVFIAAPREDNIDPIVVVQVKGGYVQLARW